MNPIHNPTPHFYEFHFNIIVHVRGMSKKFGEWSDISTETWARCVRMHMAVQIYAEKRHLA